MAIEKLRDLKYEFRNVHPVPYVCFFNIHLFLQNTVFLGHQKFSSDQEMTAAVVSYFTDLKEKHFRNGMAQINALILRDFGENKNNF